MRPPLALQQLNLVAHDVGASVAFYLRLGLVAREGPPEWRLHHVTFEARRGGLELEIDSVAFASQWNRGLRVASGGGTVVLGFQLDTREDVDRVCDELARAGHAVQQPPYDAFWGARYAVVEDPDGNAVGLMSPIDASRRSRPPPPPP